jgi:ABC-type phosphate/phosphonate transport system substrate-binding protein
MSYLFRGAILAAPLAAILVLVPAGRGDRTGNTPDTRPPVVRIGAVAYAPSAVTVFESVRRYFAKHGMPVDYVLYSNYDALVEALHKGQVDIAWNTPLAHAQYHLLAGGHSQTLVMRDVDCDYRCKLLVRKGSGITSPQGLAGKTLVLGSHESAEAVVLPVYFLKKEGADFDKVKVVSLDKEVDFGGNPCCSPVHVLKALSEGRGDAGIIGERMWNDLLTQKSPQIEGLEVVDLAAVQSLCVHGQQGLRQRPGCTLHRADAGDGRQGRVHERSAAAGGGEEMGRWEP